jgi:hypothetical protein
MRACTANRPWRVVLLHNCTKDKNIGDKHNHEDSDFWLPAATIVV